MIKGSGINFFIQQANLTDLFKVFYSFESGSSVQSISGGQSGYSGIINGNSTLFWSNPGSGTFSGTSVLVSNQNTLSGDAFTNLISFECATTGRQILISNLTDGSGYEFGLNDAHKMYFLSRFAGNNIYATSELDLSSKNLVSLAYVTNHVELGYYNFNSQKFEVESFNDNFGDVRNDRSFVIGSGFTGLIDYYLNSNFFINQTSLSQLASGWAFIPTGTGLSITQNCFGAITGYSLEPYFQTGYISYSGNILASDGLDEFANAFPTETSVVQITGIVASGYIQQPLTGLKCSYVTGAPIILFDQLTGYAASFGMDKVLSKRFIDSGDIYLLQLDRTPFNDFYNKQTEVLGSGAFSSEAVKSGEANFYQNGLSLVESGLKFGNQSVIYAGIGLGDYVYYDNKSGSRAYLDFDSAVIPYSGQQIFINGQRIISGLNFVCSGNQIILTGSHSGVVGTVSEVPIVLPVQTGYSNIVTGAKFGRRGSLFYLNGVRQNLNYDYVEGGNFDLLKDNMYNENINSEIYNGNGQYWE